VIVVSNSSPITNLAAIGQLELLRQLYQQVIIPEAVFQKLTAESGHHPGAIVQRSHLPRGDRETSSYRAPSIHLEAML